MKIKTIAAGIAAAGFLAAGAAHAGTISLQQTYSDNDTNTVLDVFGAPGDRLYDNVKINVGGNHMHVYAGAFQVTETGTNNDWLAFCVDLAQFYSMPAQFDMDPNLFGSSIVDRLDKLYTNYFADVTSNAAAAGFQVAVWEIVTDTALNLSNGGFILKGDSLNDAARNAANGFLNGLDALTGGGYDLTFLQNDDYQDLIIADTSPVPLPAGGLLLLAGLGAFGAARRVKR